MVSPSIATAITPLKLRPTFWIPRKSGSNKEEIKCKTAGRKLNKNNL